MPEEHPLQAEFDKFLFAGRNSDKIKGLALEYILEHRLTDFSDFLYDYEEGFYEGKID